MEVDQDIKRSRANIEPPRSMLKEGYLLKRQRGQHRGQNLRGLKFQGRYVRLDTEYLFYSDKKTSYQDKKKFPVSSIAIVEEVPPNTFGNSGFYFQIGNQDEVMYFGAVNERIRSEWIEVFRIAAQHAKNTMLDHYHIGAFGKTAANQWSCCGRREKSARGCHGTTAPAADKPCDAQSLKSIDSGISADKYSSRSSLISIGLQGAVSPGVQRRVRALMKDAHNEETEADSVADSLIEALKENGYELKAFYNCDSALNYLSFGGVEILLAACSNGKIYMLDVFQETKLPNSLLDDLHCEVNSMSTWKNLVAIGTKTGIHVRDLDRKELKYTVTAQTEHKHVTFSPDGSRLITADDSRNVLEIWQLDAVMSPRNYDIKPTNTTNFSGDLLAMTLSPDPNHSMAAIVTAKSENMILHIIYWDIPAHNEVIINYKFYPSSRVRIAFSPCELEKLVIGHHNILVLFDIEKQTFHPLPTDEDMIITSVQYSPTGDELVVGLNSGRILVLREQKRRNNDLKIHHILDFVTHEENIGISSVSFSKDCSMFAVGCTDGKLHIISRTSAIKPMNQQHSARSHSTVTVKHTGGTLQAGDDITVVFPERFTEQQSLSFQFNVKAREFFGPCTFPDGVRPVSAILSLHPENNTKFLKPIQITMPHFIDLETAEDCTRLTFFKACLDDCKNGQRILNFREVSRTDVQLFTYYRRNKDGSIACKVPFATLNTDHCCCYCVGEFFKEDTNKALFCLIQAEESSKLVDTSQELTLHYCLSYYLSTCVKNVEEQFPCEAYKLKYHVVKFKGDSDVDDPGMSIEIVNEGQLKSDGWNCYIDNQSDDKKIYRKDVCFWNIPDTYQLGEMCRQKLYPPRFIVSISSSNSSCSDSSLVTIFPGAVEAMRRGKPKFTYQLKAPKSSASHNSRNSSVNSQAQVFTSSHSSIDRNKSLSLKKSGTRHEAAALQKSTSYLWKNVKMSREFIVELYSKELLTPDQMKTIEDLMWKEDEESRATLKTLIAITENVKEMPEKFDIFCKLLEHFGSHNCAKYLKHIIAGLDPGFLGSKVSVESEKSSSSHDEYHHSDEGSNDVFLEGHGQFMGTLFPPNDQPKLLPEATQPFLAQN